MFINSKSSVSSNFIFIFKPVQKTTSLKTNSAGDYTWKSRISQNIWLFPQLINSLNQPFLLPGCQESQLYSLPFGQPVSRMYLYKPKIFIWPKENQKLFDWSQFFCNMHFAKKLSDNLSTKFTIYRTLLSLHADFPPPKMLLNFNPTLIHFLKIWTFPRG